MFKICAIQSKEEQERYLRECGGVARDGFFAYAMTQADSGKLMGISQFEILGDEGYISDIRAVPGLDDFEAMFILGRSTMNFIDMCGAHKCRADAKAGEERLMLGIGFKLRGEEYFADMSGMFSGHCDGHAKELDKMK